LISANPLTRVYRDALGAAALMKSGAGLISLFPAAAAAAAAVTADTERLGRAAAVHDRLPVRGRAAKAPVVGPLRRCKAARRTRVATTLIELDGATRQPISHRRGAVAALVVVRAPVGRSHSVCRRDCPVHHL